MLVCAAFLTGVAGRVSTALIHGKASATRKRMRALCESDPILGDNTDAIFSIGRKEDYGRMLQKWHRVIQLTTEHGLTDGEQATLTAIARVDSGVGLHSGVFVPTMLKQTTDEQVAAWGHQLWPKGKMLGCYAQTGESSCQLQALADESLTFSCALPLPRRDRSRLQRPRPRDDLHLYAGDGRV